MFHLTLGRFRKTFMGGLGHPYAACCLCVLMSTYKKHASLSNPLMYYESFSICYDIAAQHNGLRKFYQVTYDDRREG